MFAVLRRIARPTVRPAVVAVTVLAALAASALAYADGIDVSHWQGTVSWPKVKSDGVTFAFMKATEGDYYTDPTLAANWAGAEKAGIYRAAYHFARPTLGSAAEQATYFVSKAGTFSDVGDLPPVLDLEETGGLSVAHLQRWVRNWLTTTESLTGRTPILYFSPSFWVDHMGDSTAFTQYPLWIANYTTGQPTVPGSWPTWTFWQRTSSGTVKGISGLVDLNRFNGSNAQLALLANSSGGSGDPAPSGPTVPVGAPTSLTVTPATTTPGIDDTVSFTGSLAGTTPVKAIKNRDIALWARSVATSTWSQVATGTTDSTGTYTMAVEVRRSADYQARWVGGPKWAASASPLVRLTTPRRTATAVDLHKSTSRVRSGHAMQLYGHLTTAAGPLSGGVVRYWKRSVHGHHWTYVGRSRSVSPTGWHSLTIHPKVARVWKVVFRATDFYRHSHSARIKVRLRH